MKSNAMRGSLRRAISRMSSRLTADWMFMAAYVMAAAARAQERTRRKFHMLNLRIHQAVGEKHVGRVAFDHLCHSRELGMDLLQPRFGKPFGRSHQAQRGERLAVGRMQGKGKRVD